MTEYERQREHARQEAIVWQLNMEKNRDYSWNDYYEDQQYFIALAEKYDLTEEFHENGLI